MTAFIVPCLCKRYSQFCTPLIIEQSYKEEAKKQRYIIQTLEKERDHYGKDAATAQQSCIAQMEEVKTKEMQLYQLKKKIAESESKLKQQQVCVHRLVLCRDSMTNPTKSCVFVACDDAHRMDSAYNDVFVFSPPTWTRPCTKLCAVTVTCAVRTSLRHEMR